MLDIKENFIEHAKKYDNAIEEGNHKLANNLHGKLMVMYQRIKNEEKWDVLYELINSSNESVKLWAATFLLNKDKETALEVLNTLKKSKKIIGLTASTIIDMWNKSLLQL